MLRIAIVDDEQKEREQLKLYVERYFSASEEVTVLLYDNGETLIRDMPKALDILFLDIQMGQIDGISAARKIREYDEEVLIIFVTNMAQHAIAGYSVEALDYIIKPVDEAGAARTLDKAVKRLKSKASVLISVRSREGVLVVNTKDIWYIETCNRHILLHTVKEELLCNETMQSIEQRLPPSFFRCHNAYLVNLRQVERIAGSDIIIRGQKIPLSKHRRKGFMQAMTRYVKEIL